MYPSSVCGHSYENYIVSQMAQSLKIIPFEDLIISTGACSLGLVLIAQSSKGVRSIFLGHSKDRLIKEIKKQFPNARFIDDPKRLQDKIDLICGYVDRPIGSLNLPLDMCGTRFQICVWNAIKNIPPGRTASYKDIAQRLHHPKASRAVAGACARNLLSLAIPCHRVIGSNGKLAGYRWGVEIKKSLLNRESFFKFFFVFLIYGIHAIPQYVH